MQNCSFTRRFYKWPFLPLGEEKQYIDRYRRIFRTKRGEITEELENSEGIQKGYK
jgi:hypothetical protein